MSYTIEFFNGKVRHISDDEAKQLMKGKHNGEPSAVIRGEIMDMKSVARVCPFNEWRDEEEQRFARQGKRIQVCHFGQYHESDYETCRCASEGREPLNEDGVKLLSQAIPKLSPVPVTDADGNIIETL